MCVIYPCWYFKKGFLAISQQLPHNLFHLFKTQVKILKLTYLGFTATVDYYNHGCYIHPHQIIPDIIHTSHRKGIFFQGLYPIRKLQLSLINFLNALVLETLPPPQEILMPSVGGVWIFSDTVCTFAEKKSQFNNTCILKVQYDGKCQMFHITICSILNVHVMNS